MFGGNRSRHAVCFTLIELLVVVAIIAVLIAVLLPGLNTARDAAKGVDCLSRIRQTSTATFMYTNDHEGRLPPFYDTHHLPYVPSDPDTGWFARISPYLGIADDHLDGQADIWKCPSGTARIGVHYGGFNAYAFLAAPFCYGSLDSSGAVEVYPPIKVDRINDPATWIAFLDTAPLSGFMYTPTMWPFAYDASGDEVPDSYNTLAEEEYNRARPHAHRNGCNIGLCDGHGRRISFATWQNMNNGLWTD